MPFSFDPKPNNVAKLAYRHFLTCSCLLIFVFSICGQDKPADIVWSNVAKSYTDFRDIQPHLELKERELVLWKLLPLYVLLYRFDDEQKNWIEGDYVLTDTVGMITRSLILKKDVVLKDFFSAGQFFEWEKGKGYFFTSQNRKQYPVNGKYRITFFYGTDLVQPDKLNNYSNSPEFTISWKYPATK